MSFPDLGKFGTLFQLIGLLFVARKVIKGLIGIYRAFFRKRKDLLARYGRNTWALVTGASDGIGQEFCRQLARIGFNVVLLARSESKLNETAKELIKLNPNIKTQVVVADLSKANEDKFIPEIMDQIKDLDISILINNAGIDVFDHFMEIDLNYIKKMITINCTALMSLTQKMCQKMRHRSRKSAIINVSSGAVNLPLAYYSTYNGTKALVDWFTLSVADELPNIDFMSMKPYDVSTSMINNRNPDALTITREECVRGFLNCLGHEVQSVGHWKHRIQDAVFTSLPRWFVNILFFKFFSADFFAERKHLIPVYRGLPAETKAEGQTQESKKTA